MDLSHRFTELCRSIGITTEKAESVFRGLTAHYSEQHRSYHNLAHITYMLDELDASGVHSVDIELAIWFHDAIYDPKKQDNELQSAEYFRAELGIHLDDKLSEDVFRLIIATDPTRPRSEQADENLLIDIDLSILGAEPAAYNEYKNAIRSEYSHVPEKEFNAGRIGILTHFLSREIYATECFKTRENQARDNISAEIEILTPSHI